MFYSNKEWYYFLANICIIPRNLNYEKNIDGALSVICINSFFNAFLKVSVFWKSNIIKLNSRLQFSIMFKRLRCGFRQTWIDQEKGWSRVLENYCHLMVTAPSRLQLLRNDIRDSTWWAKETWIKWSSQVTRQTNKGAKAATLGGMRLEISIQSYYNII